MHTVVLLFFRKILPAAARTGFIYGCLVIFSKSRLFPALANAFFCFRGFHSTFAPRCSEGDNLFKNHKRF